MSGRWWRAYSRARHDPKLLRLSDKHFRWWFNFVCAAADNDGTLPSHADLSVEFRASGRVVTQMLDALIEVGLFDHDETGIHPHNWDGLQYKSDVSNERVKRFRKRKRNGECNVTSNDIVTPSESETESEQSRAESNAPKAHCLPHDWKPSEEGRAYALSRHLNPDRVAEAFIDYWTGGKGAKQRRTDWDRTWRVWCDRETPKAGATPNVVRFNG